jgi:hypothetical protein
MDSTGPGDPPTKKQRLLTFFPVVARKGATIGDSIGRPAEPVGLLAAHQHVVSGKKPLGLQNKNNLCFFNAGLQLLNSAPKLSGLAMMEINRSSVPSPELVIDRLGRVNRKVGFVL